MSFTVDTAALAAGEIITFNPNANGLASVYLGGATYTILASPANISVTAVLEQSCLTAMPLLGGLVLTRRKRALIETENYNQTEKRARLSLLFSSTDAGIQCHRVSMLLKEKPVDPSVV